jgi:hypothetical protein
MLSDRVRLDQRQEIAREGQGGIATDAIPRERDSSIQEAHVDFSSGSSGRLDRHLIVPEHRLSHQLIGGLRAAL